MKTSKYQNAYDTLKDEILSGKYSTRNPFPSVAGACRRFGISSLTIVKVFDRLKADGLICARKGAGTFVTRQGRLRKIGLIIPGICYSEIFPPICKELSRQAQETGYTLLFGDLSSLDPEERARRARSLARQYVEEGVAGVIFQPIEFLKDADRVNQDILSAFDAAGVPVVLLDCDVVASPGRSRYDIVGVNNAEAGRRLAQHIVEAGARRIVFLSRPHSDYSVRNRIEGVRDVLTNVKGSFAELSIDVNDLGAVRKMLSRRSGPDAVVCRNDHQAAHLLATLRKLGKNVPEDVLVAGFNDVEYASLLDPGLTTIHIPTEDIARQTFSFLLERIVRPALPARECYLSAPLIVRASTTRVSKKKRIKAKGIRP